MTPPPPPPSVLDIARRYIAAGLSVIPVRADGSKAPKLNKNEVEQYRERFATEEELKDWFAPNRAVGIAIVCGKVSGNLAVLDFESDAVWQQWKARVEGTPMAAIVNSSPIVRTPKGGRHVYCQLLESWVAGGQLAKRSKSELLIEVRGQGHYVLAPGSPPACHERNVPYTWESKGWLTDAV